MSDSRRFVELDVFRGLAALVVVLYHYVYRFGEFYGHPELAWQWGYLGRYGVHLFFIISGFVIYWSLERSASLRDFLVSRFSRIYPAYWVAVLLTFSVVAWGGLEGREVGFTAMLINLSMAQEYAGAPHVDYAYWTLTVELTFYALIMSLFIIGQLQRVHWVGAGLMLLSIAMHMQWLPFGLVVPWLVQKILLLKYVQLFTAGILFYRLYRGDPMRGTLALLLLCMATNLAAYPFVDALLLCGFFALFLLALGGWFRPLCVKPLLWLGGISYTLYLLHQNIGYVFMQSLYEMNLPGWLVVTLTLVVILTLAHVLSSVVERPATRWIRSCRVGPMTVEAGSLPAEPVRLPAGEPAVASTVSSGFGQGAFGPGARVQSSGDRAFGTTHKPRTPAVH